MDEIKEYGQQSPDKFRKIWRKSGGFFTLILGAVYTYILLRYTHATEGSVISVVAMIGFNAVGFLSLAIGAFSPLGSLSVSVWHRLILSVIGIAGIGAGTYVGVDTMVRRSGEVEVWPHIHYPDASGRVSYLKEDVICQLGPTPSRCVGVRIAPDNGMTLMHFHFHLRPIRRNPGESVVGIVLWLRGDSAGERVRLWAPCWGPMKDDQRIGSPIFSEWTQLADRWQQVTIRNTDKGCQFDPFYLDLAAEVSSNQRELTMFFGGATLQFQ
jgi:hypothetical protein